MHHQIIVLLYYCIIGFKLLVLLVTGYRMNTKKIIEISINIKRIVGIMIIFKILFFILFSISCHGNFGVDLSIKLEQSDWLQLEVQFGVTISSASLHILFYNHILR